LRNTFDHDEAGGVENELFDITFGWDWVIQSSGWLASAYPHSFREHNESVPTRAGRANGAPQAIDGASRLLLVVCSCETPSIMMRQEEWKTIFLISLCAGIKSLRPQCLPRTMFAGRLHRENSPRRHGQMATLGILRLRAWDFPVLRWDRCASLRMTGVRRFRGSVKSFAACHVERSAGRKLAERT
jgi:hypothetical protein